MQNFSNLIFENWDQLRINPANINICGLSNGGLIFKRTDFSLAAFYWDFSPSVFITWDHLHVKVAF